MPVDIERTSTHLRTTFRGYDRTQVLEVMQKAAKEMSALRGDIEAMQQQMERQRLELEALRAQENVLKETLILAQRAADEARSSAHRDAESILEEARRKADEIEQQAQHRISDLRWELERLRLEKQKFLNSYRSLLETQLRDLTEAGGFAVVEAAVEDAARA